MIKAEPKQVGLICFLLRSENREKIEGRKERKERKNRLAWQIRLEIQNSKNLHHLHLRSVVSVSLHLCMFNMHKNMYLEI